MHFVLIPFKDTALVAIDGDFEMGAGRIDCSWHIHGSLDRVLMPESDESRGRKMSLWEHTCFEFFIGEAGDLRYCEFNLSPGGAWNSFSFTDVREGMNETPWLALTGHRFERTARDAYIHASLSFAMPAATGPWHVGVSAVIEEVEGAKHYFALAHASGRPDFHDRRNRTLATQ